MKKMLFVFCLLIVQAGFLSAQEKLLELLKDELKQEMEEMKSWELPPYYMNYRVVDEKRLSISASFGALMQENDSHFRIVVPQIRVGSPESDNFKLMDMGSDIPQNRAPSVGFIPLDEQNNEEAVRMAIWGEVNERYRFVTKVYQQTQEYEKITVANEDQSVCFSPAKAESYYEAPLAAHETEVDRGEWIKKLKEISAVFRDYPKMLDGDASLVFKVVRTYFVSSEGTSVVHNLTYANLIISGSTKAEDGMLLPLNLSYFARHPEGLPDVRFILDETGKMAKKLMELRKAPVVGPFSGPVLLSGSAAGVFFHEIFGHRVEGQRMRHDADGQTFKKKIGEYVLPVGMQVFDDPGMETYGGQKLNGYYKYDEQGVKAERVDIVIDGKIHDFLMTRKPLENFPRSNGHARAVGGFDPVSRQSNLIIETKDHKTTAQLRELLLKEIVAQGKAYGYFFKKVSGGFTQTSKVAINSFNVSPLEVYRVYPDGRPDELVRGVDLIGTPLMMFSSIVEAGGESEIFTGTCGAESGGIPVSAIAPSLFVKKVEMQRKAKSQDMLPILGSPLEKSSK